MSVCIVSPYKGLFSRKQTKKIKQGLPALTTETSLLPLGLEHFGFSALTNSFLPWSKRSLLWARKEVFSDGSRTNQHGQLSLNYELFCAFFFLRLGANFVKSSDSTFGASESNGLKLL